MSRSRRPPFPPLLLAAVLTLLTGIAAAPAHADTRVPHRADERRHASEHSATAADRVATDDLDRAGAAKARLDAKQGEAPAEVTSWYVDHVTGQTTVSVAGPATDAGARFAADPDAGAVLVIPYSDDPAPLAATGLLGGQTITNSGVRCSVGFDAVRADRTPVFITAGHCTQTAGTWAGPDRTAVGTVLTSAWPKTDYGTVSIANTAAWTGVGQVSGGPAVKGAAVAAVGAAVCHSGSTSGYRCGTVTARDVTVNYGNGNLVQGLTKTSACAAKGDSGGSFITPAGQAQGVASGGAGDCTNNGSSYFQPLAPVLSALRLTLDTSP